MGGNGRLAGAAGADGCEEIGAAGCDEVGADGSPDAGLSLNF